LGQQPPLKKSMWGADENLTAKAVGWRRDWQAGTETKRKSIVKKKRSV